MSLSKFPDRAHKQFFNPVSQGHMALTCWVYCVVSSTFLEQTVGWAWSATYPSMFMPRRAGARFFWLHVGERAQRSSVSFYTRIHCDCVKQFYVYVGWINQWATLILRSAWLTGEIGSCTAYNHSLCRSTEVLIYNSSCCRVGEEALYSKIKGIKPLFARFLLRWFIFNVSRDLTSN